MSETVTPAAQTPRADASATVNLTTPQARNGKPTRGESREYALSQPDLHRFEAAARTPRERAYVRFLARWGLRAGEASHVCLDWFSGQRGVLTVPRTCRCAMCNEDSLSGAWRSKNEAANRALPIYKHTESWEAAKIFFTNCPTPAESQVSRQAVWKLVKTVADRAGLLHLVFPHALRATAATQFASMGFNELQLCRVMGWTDLRSAKPYIRTSSATIENALDGKDLRWW